MLSAIEELVAYLHSYYARSWKPWRPLDSRRIPPDIPYALALLYREFGELMLQVQGSRQPFSSADRLRRVGELKRVDGMLQFAVENQAVWTCLCPLGPDDPPVYSDAPDETHEFGGPFRQVGDSLAHFLVTMSLLEAAFAAPNVRTISDGRSVEDALTGYRPLWLRGRYADGSPSYHFYDVLETDTLIVQHDCWDAGTIVHVATANPKHGFDCLRPRQ